MQDYAAVLERWGADLPADQLHVVTVPPSGADRPACCGIASPGCSASTRPPSTPSPGRSNSSLGAEQAELLRRVNLELGDRLPLPGPYPLVVKNVLAHRMLTARKGTPLRLVPDDVTFAVQESRRIAERLDGLGVNVLGDLQEIVPDEAVARAAADEGAYAAPRDEVLLEESLEAVTGLLQALAGRRAQRRLEEEHAALRDAPVRYVARSYVRKHPRLAGAVRRVRRR